jgi:hypothetical protein
MGKSEENVNSSKQRLTFSPIRLDGVQMFDPSSTSTPCIFSNSICFCERTMSVRRADEEKKRHLNFDLIFNASQRF